MLLVIITSTRVFFVGELILKLIIEKKSQNIKMELSKNQLLSSFLSCFFAHKKLTQFSRLKKVEVDGNKL